MGKCRQTMSPLGWSRKPKLPINVIIIRGFWSLKTCGWQTNYILWFTIHLRYTVCLPARRILSTSKTKTGWVGGGGYTWADECSIWQTFHKEQREGNVFLQPLLLLLCCHILPIESSWENHMPLSYRIRVRKYMIAGKVRIKWESICKPPECNSWHEAAEDVPALHSSTCPHRQHGALNTLVSCNSQLINFPPRDHGAPGETRSRLHPAASAEAAGWRAPWRGHNTGRHRCSGGGIRAHRKRVWSYRYLGVEVWRVVMRTQMLWC